MAISPACTITGNFETLLGSDQGYAVFQLAGFNQNIGIPIVAGTGLIAQTRYQTPTGTSFSITIWGNDVISVPTGATYYVVSIYDSTGSPRSQNTYYLTGSGGDLSTLTPLNGSSAPTPPAGQQNANTVYAGPPSGGPALPTFRSEVTADLPTSGTWPFSGTISGTPTFSALASFKNLEQVLYADQFSGSDIGQKINNAIAALPTILDSSSGNTYKCGVISLVGFTGQTVTQTTTVSITSPFVSIIGPGSGALMINYTGTGDAFRITLASSWTVSQAGQISGFYLNGNSNANACGIHYGDIIGLTLEDLVISGFTGTSSAGLWCDNTTEFTERTVILKVHLNYNTWGWLFTASSISGQSSMAYQKCLDLRLNVTTNQIGIYQKHITGDTSIYHGIFNISANFTGSAKTFFKQESDATFQDNSVSILTEDNGTSGGTWLVSASGSHFSFYGNINHSSTTGSAMTNSVSGVYIQNWSIFTDSVNPTPTNAGLTSFIPATAATNTQNVNGQPLTLQGNYWTGSASAQSGLTQQVTFGSGSNPAMSYVISKYAASLFTVWDASAIDVTLFGAVQLFDAAVSASGSILSVGNGTSNSASAGSTQAVPATVLGYFEWYLGSTLVKIPYFSA